MACTLAAFQGESGVAGILPVEHIPGQRPRLARKYLKDDGTFPAAGHLRQDAVRAVEPAPSLAYGQMRDGAEDEFVRSVVGGQSLLHGSIQVIQEAIALH